MPSANGLIRHTDAIHELMVRCGVKFGLYKTTPSGSSATRRNRRKTPFADGVSLAYGNTASAHLCGIAVVL